MKMTMKTPEKLNRICPACGQKEGEDYRILYKAPHEVLECLNCHLVFINEELTIIEPGEFGIQYFQKNLKARQRDFETLQAYIQASGPQSMTEKKPMKLLDIGCGLGDFLRVASSKGWEPYGVDINKSVIAYLQESQELNVEAGNIENGIEFPERCFDIITMFGVIEHLVNPPDAIKECHRMLRPGGILCLQTPTEDGFLRKVGRSLYQLSFEKLNFHVEQLYFLNGGHNLCFCRKSIQTLLDTYNFEVLEIAGSTFGLKSILQRFGLHPRGIIEVIGTSTFFALGKILRMPNHMTVYAQKMT
jgi:2-polyprenyl-3-methyl-5-hydroxy-6-metoxy-1,4-benzoquinol methylase